MQLVKLAFITNTLYPDVNMLKYVSSTECVLPRPMKRCLPPLPEDKECSNMEFKKFGKIKKRKQRKLCLKLPSLPEHDEF